MHTEIDVKEYLLSIVQNAVNPGKIPKRHNLFKTVIRKLQINVDNFAAKVFIYNKM
jgi:hypothetical protein